MLCWCTINLKVWSKKGKFSVSLKRISLFGLNTDAKINCYKLKKMGGNEAQQETPVFPVKKRKHSAHSVNGSVEFYLFEIN